MLIKRGLYIKMMNNLLKSFKYLTKKKQNVVPVIDFFQNHKIFIGSLKTITFILSALVRNLNGKNSFSAGKFYVHLVYADFTS